MSMQEMVRGIWNGRGESQRRRRVASLIEVYEGNHASQVEKLLRQFFKEQQYQLMLPKMTTSLNLLRQATDQLAPIYSAPAERVIVTEDGEEVLPPSAYIADGRLDMTLDTAARLLFVCRELFIRPFVGDDGAIVLDVVTPDRVSVVPSKTDPAGISSLVVQSPSGFTYWDKSVAVRLDKGFYEIEMEEHGLGAIPYIAAHLTYPLSSFWHEQSSVPLRDATLLACVRMTDHIHLEHMCSHKQLALSSKLQGDAPEVVLDPTSVLIVRDGGKGGSATVLDMQADLGQHLDSILDEAAATLNLYGIRPEQTRGTLTASSGYALQIQMYSQERVWASMRTMWSHWESRLYRMAAAVAYVTGGTAFPAGDLVVRHAAIGPPLSLREKAETATALMDAGWTPLAATMKAFGLSEDQAKPVLVEKEKEEK